METMSSPDRSDLSAPPGWTKKLTPKKGGVPKRNEVYFISPTGEEVKNKKQLDQYLKSHPGGPLFSEFDWTTGETPRRSARISEKVKAIDTPENEPPKKRGRRSSAAKEAEEKDGENEAPEDTEVATEDTKANADAKVDEVDKGNKVDTEGASATEDLKASADVEMKKTDDGQNKVESEAATATEEPKVNVDINVKEVDEEEKKAEDVTTTKIGENVDSVVQKDLDAEKNDENSQKSNLVVKDEEAERLAKKDEAGGEQLVESKFEPPASELTNENETLLKENNVEGLPAKNTQEGIQESKTADMLSAVIGPSTASC